MDKYPEALCVLAGPPSWLRIADILTRTPYRWTCVQVTLADANPIDPDDWPTPFMPLTAVTQPFTPVDWFEEPFMDCGQRLHRLVHELSPSVCWVVGAPSLALVALQGRACGLSSVSTRWLVSSGESWIGEESFPRRAMEAYAADEVVNLADASFETGQEVEAALKRWSEEPPPQPQVETEDPFLSVCIPHYNYGNYLGEQLESLRQQSYTNFEVIVIDDGSTDEASQQQWQKHETEFADDRFKFVRRLENRGLCATRNEAVERARGEWIVFCDADNRSDPRMLERLATAARRTQADVVTGYVRQFRVDDKGEEATAVFYTPLGACVELGWLYNVFGDANALVRRDTFQSVGGFTSEPGLTAEDWHLFARIAWKGGRFAVVPEVLFDYRIHGESVMHTRSWEASTAQIRRIYDSEAEGMPKERQRRCWKWFLRTLCDAQQWREERNRYWLEKKTLWQEHQKTTAYLEELREGNAWLQGQKDALAGEKESLWQEHQKTAAYLEALREGNEWLQGQKESLVAEKESLWQEHQKATAYLEELREGNEWLQGQKESLMAETERLNQRIGELADHSESLRQEKAELERRLAALKRWQNFPFWKRWTTKRPESV